MASFAVAGFGRSGTMFLANALNSDPYWEVKHEPVGGFHSTRIVQCRFNQYEKNYGEVNSWLRFNLVGLLVQEKRIILRNPWDILQSMYNRGRYKPQDVMELYWSLLLLDGLAQSGIPTISFSRMTTDLSYLASVAGGLGVQLGEIHLAKKVNASSYRGPLPREMKKEADKRFTWFAQAYEDLW